MTTLRLAVVMVMILYIITIVVMGIVAIARNPGVWPSTGAGVCLGVVCGMRIIEWMVPPDDEGGEGEGEG